ncbi:MAG: hypothetical protein IBJ14_03250 [Hydrogenophaga sp.]|nr:hypothetical protein [Hydrogenophaga sp.]
MEELWKTVTTPSWLVSVVVAGVFVNLLSAFLQRKLEKAGLSFSKWRRDHSEKKQRQFEEQVHRLVARPERIPSAYALEARWRARGLYVLGTGILTWILVVSIAPLDTFGWLRSVMVVLAALGLLVSTRLDTAADQLSDAIAEAQKQLDQIADLDVPP